MTTFKFIYLIIVYLFGAAFFSKIILHVYLDNANGYKLAAGSISSFIYLLPYDKEVSERFIKAKIICNWLQKMSIFLFVSTIILLIINTVLD